MKAPIHAVMPLFLLVLLGSCSKEIVEPTTISVALNDTKWRLTDRRQEHYANDNPTKLLSQYSFSAYCLGGNTITFSASGQVLWVREAGSCTNLNSNPPALTQIVWGQWQLEDAPAQLRIIVKNEYSSASIDESALPMVPSTLGTYSVSELSTEKMILSQPVTGAPKDSLYVLRSVFTRVAE